VEEATINQVLRPLALSKTSSSALLLALLLKVSYPRLRNGAVYTQKSRDRVRSNYSYWRVFITRIRVRDLRP